MTKPNTSFKYSTKAKSRLDIVIGTLLLITFILIITRLAVKGTPSTRTNTWGLAVVRPGQITYLTPKICTTTLTLC